MQLFTWIESTTNTYNLCNKMESKVSKDNVSLETSGNLTSGGNITRQLFNPEHEGLNKALATSLRLSYMPHIKYIPEYINKESFTHLLLQDNGVNFVNVVISAVDNEATRKEVIEALDETANLNFVYINCGNSLDTAHLSVWTRLNNVYTFISPLRRYANLANPSDVVPGRCSTLEASTPQLISANNAAANLVLATMQNILDTQPIYEEVNSYIRSMKTRPLGNPQVILTNN